MRQLQWIYSGDITHTGPEKMFYCEIKKRHKGAFDYSVEVGLYSQQGTSSTLTKAMEICQNICEEISNNIISTL